MRSYATRALKNNGDFKTDSINTQELARVILAVKSSIAGTSAPAKDVFMYNKQKKEPALTNKWARRLSEIKSACNKWTDEEMRLYECMALTGWENR